MDSRGAAGRAQVRRRRPGEHWKAKGLDFSRILTKPAVPDSVALYNSET